MRVTHVLNRLNFLDGGPPRGVVDLCEAIHKIGHDVTLITTDTTDVPSSWESNIGCCCVNGPDLPLGFFSSSSLEVASRLVADSEIVHFHGVWDRINHQLARIANRNNVPYVITLRGMLDDWTIGRGLWYKSLFLKVYGQAYLDNAACIQCTAAGELRQSKKWFQDTPATVIPNMMDLSEFQIPVTRDEADSAYGSLLDGPTLLFLSRIHEKKGLEHLITALRIVLDRFGPCNLVIAGQGDENYEQQLRALAKKEGVEEFIHWVGHVGGTLKYSLFNSADLFVLPSSQENFGFVLFESMACGTPVLVSDMIDTADDIEKCGGGLQVRQNPTHIADTAIKLLQDPEARKEMAARGRDWVLKHLDSRDLAVRIEEMYKNAIKNRP